MLKNWQDWLSSNNRGWRVLAGTLAVFFLAIFLHFREIKLESLELNASASRYVVAQVDFEFPDYETTILLRQQAIKDVGLVFQLDDKQIRDTRNALEEDLTHNKAWRRAAPESTFEEMYKAADVVETQLLEARFTDPRTIKKVKEIGFSESAYFEFMPEENDAVLLPELFWKRASGNLFASGVFHQETVDYVLSAFRKRAWHLFEDIALERSLRAQVSRTVPEKHTKVFAGTRLIDQGETVTTRHLAMMQSMKEALHDSRKLSDPLTLLASFISALIFVTVSGLYFRISQPAFIRSLRHISLFVCITLTTLLFSKLAEYGLVHSTPSVAEAMRYPIMAPFATILICTLLSPRTALFAATFITILLSVNLAVDQGRFLLLNLVTSMVVIISAQSVRKRKDIFVVCLKSWLASIPLLFAFALADHALGMTFVYDVATTLASLLLTAVIVTGLLPALETLFGVLTDVTLMEWMDPNSELLRQFALEVPGTYQHSLALGNLSESCAQAIGVSGLFCRAATLYHDIGKMNNPQFYTENQNGPVNIHQLLTPLESAQVIISHVTDGVEIARAHRLPETFIDIIREHHGTTLVYYFYRKQQDLQLECRETSFRYPGPKPRTKESAIIMICDSVEAASRSLEEVTETSLMELISRIVADKAEDGQFDDCALTFEELGRIKATLVKTLMLASHVRIKYPKRAFSN